MSVTNPLRTIRRVVTATAVARWCVVVAAAGGVEQRPGSRVGDNGSVPAALSSPLALGAPPIGDAALGEPHLPDPPSSVSVSTIWPIANPLVLLLDLSKKSVGKSTVATPEPSSVTLSTSSVLRRDRSSEADADVTGAEALPAARRSTWFDAGLGAATRVIAYETAPR